MYYGPETSETRQCEHGKRYDENCPACENEQVKYIICPRCKEELGDCEPDGCRDPLCPMQEQFDYNRDPVNQPENIR